MYAVNIDKYTTLADLMDTRIFSDIKVVESDYGTRIMLIYNGYEVLTNIPFNEDTVIIDEYSVPGSKGGMGRIDGDISEFSLYFSDVEYDKYDEVMKELHEKNIFAISIKVQ